MKSFLILLILGVSNLPGETTNVLKFKYHWINGLDRNLELYQEDFTILIDFKENFFVIQPNNKKFSEIDDYFMRGEIFDLTLDETLPILDGKFSGGIARDNFKNSKYGFIQIILDSRREAVTSVIFSFNSEKRYNWYFSNSLPSQAVKQ